jgi:hypothetical protein
MDKRRESRSGTECAILYPAPFTQWGSLSAGRPNDDGRGLGFHRGNRGSKLASLRHRDRPAPVAERPTGWRPGHPDDLRAETAEAL